MLKPCLCGEVMAISSVFSWLPDVLSSLRVTNFVLAAIAHDVRFCEALPYMFHDLYLTRASVGGVSLEATGAGFALLCPPRLSASA